MAKLKINPAILSYHNANRYYDIFSEEGLRGKKIHIKNVIPLSINIANFLGYVVDMDFLAICAEHHDDGYVNQYEIFGEFSGAEISHHALGIDRLNTFLANLEVLKIDSSIEILRDVILYHGRINLVDTRSKSFLYVSIVTAADDFENATSCISYLLKEMKTDAKGYIQADPKLNQKKVSNFVWQHFCDGEKFDETKHCSTYAEYVLSAATLVTSFIKQYGPVAELALVRRGYGYPSIIEGYHDVFLKTLTPNMAKKAIDVIVNMLS